MDIKYNAKTLMDNFFNNIQRPNTFQNRNTILYNVRIFTMQEYIQPKIDRKIRISYRPQNNIPVIIKRV